MSIRWLWKKFSCDNGFTLRRAWILLAVLAIAIPARAQDLSYPIRITSVSPTVASPSGGSHVRITGFGFIAPLRVFFELADATVEAFVVSATTTQIELFTPPVLFGPDEQMRFASVVVLAGPHQFRAVANEAFVFENHVQTPKILTVTPNSGTKRGGTRATIIGEGFQQPVQVLFGDAEARVINVTREQIVVETPAASEVGVVDVLVRNIASQTEHTLADAYRYTVDPTLLSVVPNHGRAGMKIIVNGAGFNAPVAVTFAGIAAQVISVSGTRIIALTQPPSTCASFTGPVEVINIVDGAMATGLDFTYESDLAPAIAAVNPRVIVGGKTMTVQLESAEDASFEIGGVPAEVLSRIGSTFRLRVPTTLPFATGACTLRGIEGTGPVTSRFDLRAIDRNSGCSTTRRDALTITPAASSVCTLPPLATVLPRTCSSRTVTIANERGRADLVVTLFDSDGQHMAIIPGGSNATFTVKPRAQLERLRMTTNDPRHPLLLVCVSP